MKIESLNTIEKIYELPNGRKYKVIDTGKPYVNDHYPSGGYIINTWLEKEWAYISNAPDEDAVQNFLRIAKKLDPVKK